MFRHGFGCREIVLRKGEIIMVTLKKSQFDSMIRFIAIRNKLEAVKFVAEVMNYTLADAKAYVELLSEKD